MTGFLVFVGAFLLEAMAETVLLKSGKVVDGKILEKTAQEVRVDFFGVPLTFSLDGVDAIDGERGFASVASVAVSGREVLTADAQAYGVSDRQEAFDQDFPQSRFSKDAAFMVQYVLFRRKADEGRKEEALSIMDEIGKIVSRYPEGRLERFTCQKVRQVDPVVVDIPFKYAVPYFRGYLGVKLKDFDAALKWMGFIEKDYKVSEYGKGLFIQQVHGTLIESLMDVGQLEQARTAAQRAVDQFPDSPWMEGWQKLLQQE